MSLHSDTICRQNCVIYFKKYSFACRQKPGFLFPLSPGERKQVTLQLFLNTGVSNNTCRQRLHRGFLILDIKLPAQVLNQLGCIGMRSRRWCLGFFGVHASFLVFSCKQALSSLSVVTVLTPDHLQRLPQVKGIRLLSKSAAQYKYMCFLINVHESPWQQSCVCKWLADATITDQTSLLSQLNYNDPYWPKMVLGQCNLHKEPVWNLWRCNSLGPLKQINTQVWWGPQNKKIIMLSLCDAYPAYSPSNFTPPVVLFLAFFTSFLPPFASIISSQIKPSHLPLFPLSWGLGTLGRVSPTGCVGREAVSDSPTACPLAYQAGTRTQSRAERGGQGGKHGALQW